jgi:hypothetical protein
MKGLCTVVRGELEALKGGLGGASRLSSLYEIPWIKSELEIDGKAHRPTNEDLFLICSIIVTN